MVSQIRSLQDRSSQTRSLLQSGGQKAVVLTESNFFVESNATAGFLGHNLLGGEEDAVLLLESLFSLEICHLRLS